ncbi:MAG: TIGR02646 family protein [Burkholderiales bacterium RIFCSPLOWO2_12_FULL_61_40]|nr:MAG: TIGR02646 family protein [Burkholderiales bacterium RIFCSPLOWO2_12_FULL_61_40]
MHKLHRDPVPPACLARYQHGRDPWRMESPTGPERVEIWAKLNAMQGQRCAYCEAATVEGNRHIEHFHQRNGPHRYPQGTYAWDNLFGSCNRQETCGKYKDQCGGYAQTDLVKPDIEDPEAFLVFSPDGSVHPRANLSPADRHRAAETIRILNLNGVLRQIRYSEICGYVQTAETFAEMASHLDASEWLPLLQDELRQTEQLPYATAIKHVLTRRV